MRGPSQDRVRFDEATAGFLAAFADTLIPPGDGFPPPSGIRIVEDFMTRYIAQDHAEIVYPPGVTLSDVATVVAAIGERFASAGPEERAAAVSAFESSDAELFGKLRALVYAGYYSRAEVRAAIANTLETGRDFRGTPQPYGYADVIEEWDESLFNHDGSYVKTEEVKPVDADVLARLVGSFSAGAEAKGGRA